MVVAKSLIESQIEMTKASGLSLNSIELEELSLAHALDQHLAEDKITGFIGEDDRGLIFNFYHGNELSFTRHKKGHFLPKSQEFSLKVSRRH